MRPAPGFLLAMSLWSCLASVPGCSGGDPTQPGTGPDSIIPALPRDSIVPGMPLGYRNRFYQGMRYGLFVPPFYVPSRKYPLILYLHGSTDTTTWDLNWYHDPIQSSDPVIVVTPKSLRTNSGWGTSWDAGLAVDMQLTMEILSSLEQEFSIDTTRLYVHGTSMGGFGVFNILSKRPGLFAGAYAVCGGGTPATAAQMMLTPLWIFHGSADPVVPVTYSRDIYRAITAAGGTQVRYTEYPGVAHDAWTPVGKEATLPRWLLAQRKGVSHGSPEPVANLRVVGTEAGRPSLGWSPGDTAEADRKVWFYRVYRDGTLLAEVETPAFTDAVLASGTYAYSVATVSYYFKESGRGPTVQARIP